MRSSLRSSAFASIVGFALLGACAGCEGATPSASYPLAAHPPLTLASPSLAAQDPAGAEIRQVFAQWQEARRSGDGSTLETLYDVRRFEGVRWTRNGIEKRMTWPEWSRERAAAGPVPPPAVGPTFESWAGGTLDAATASVAFEEAGPGPSHHVLVFGRGPDGKLRIVREELGGTSPSAASSGESLSRDAKVLRALAERGDK